MYISPPPFSLLSCMRRSLTLSSTSMVPEESFPPPPRLQKPRPIRRAQRQTISDLRLTAKRHNHLGVIPAERPSGSNFQVCSNHARRGPRGPLTKLSSGPSETPGGPRGNLHVPAEHTEMLHLYLHSLHARKPSEALMCAANSRDALFVFLFFLDGYVNVCNSSCVRELRVEHLRGMYLLCVPCSIPSWLDSSMPIRGPQGPLVSSALMHRSPRSSTTCMQAHTCTHKHLRADACHQIFVT